MASAASLPAMIYAAMISHNDEPTIQDAIDSVKPFVDGIFVAMSSYPINGEVIPLDKTRNICEDNGCTVLFYDERLKEHQLRNFSISQAQDAELIIVFEPDMVFESEDIKNIIRFALGSNSRSFKCRQVAYWRDRSHKLRGDKFYPVVAIKPGVRFTNCQNVDIDPLLIEGVKVHHYNWCAPKDILKKTLTYHHAPQIAKDWYEKHYLGWKEGEKAIFPDCVLEVELC